MDRWNALLLRMLVGPTLVAGSGLLLALGLQRVAVLSGQAGPGNWAGPVFQVALALALAMSVLGYRRLRRRESPVRLRPLQRLLARGGLV